MEVNKAKLLVQFLNGELTYKKKTKYKAYKKKGTQIKRGYNVYANELDSNGEASDSLIDMRKIASIATIYETQIYVVTVKGKPTYMFY